MILNTDYHKRLCIKFDTQRGIDDRDIVTSLMVRSVGCGVWMKHVVSSEQLRIQRLITSRIGSLSRIRGSSLHATSRLKRVSISLFSVILLGLVFIPHWSMIPVEIFLLVFFSQYLLYWTVSRNKVCAWKYSNVCLPRSGFMDWNLDLSPLKVKKVPYSCYWDPVSQLRGVACYMEPHSVTRHPTQANTPRLNPSQAGTQFTYPGGMEGWVDLGGWVCTKMVYLSADSHPYTFIHLLTVESKHNHIQIMMAM